MLSTPWTVRAVSLDGTRHRLLVDNQLVNWIPVIGPEGFLVYINTTASAGAEVRLIDSFGTDHGRFAPTHSNIRYMDWK